MPLGSIVEYSYTFRLTQRPKMLGEYARAFINGMNVLSTKQPTVSPSSCESDRSPCADAFIAAE